MVIFIKKIILFLVPLGLVFIFPSLIIFYGNEYFSSREIVRLQTVYPQSLFGFAYNSESFFQYKKYLVEVKKPEVIALGTSKVMQIRKEFFNDKTVFINAGGAGTTLTEMFLFLDSLPKDNSIKLILLGIDKEVFDSPMPIKENIYERNLSFRLVDILSTMSRRIYLDYFNGKYKISDLINKSNKKHDIGLSAILHQDGFRTDGSYQYGSAKKNEVRLDYVRLEIKRKVNLIVQGNNMDDKKDNLGKNMIMLGNILKIAKEKGIIIIGFTSPHPSDVYKALNEKSDETKIFSANIRNIFAGNNSDFFDLGDIKLFDGKNTEFVDAVHGTDLMYLKMFMYMAERSKSIRNYVDIDKLNFFLKESTGDFLSF